MSDFSISAITPASMAMENLASGAESMQDSNSTAISGLNEGGPDTMENAVAGAEVASRTTEFLGTGTDFSSTGTDIDISHAINTSIMDGMGSITDKVV